MEVLIRPLRCLRGRFHICPEGEVAPHFFDPDKVWHLQSQRLVKNLPMQIGRVPSSVMKAIQAEVDKAGAATGKATEPPPPANTPESKPEEEAPSDDSLNEVDDDRQASSKSVWMTMDQRRL